MTALAQGMLRLWQDPQRARATGNQGHIRCKEIFDYRVYVDRLCKTIAKTEQSE